MNHTQLNCSDVARLSRNAVARAPPPPAAPGLLLPADAAGRRRGAAHVGAAGLARQEAVHAQAVLAADDVLPRRGRPRHVGEQAVHRADEAGRLRQHAVARARRR